MTAGQVGAFLGTMAAVMTDPITILGLVVGVAFVAGVLLTTWGSAVKMLAAAAILFVSGLVTGLLKLPAVLSWQHELGRNPGFIDAAYIVVAPGVAVLLVGSLIVGVWRLAAAVWRRVRRVT
jgi:hypothetical protein